MFSSKQYILKPVFLCALILLLVVGGCATRPSTDYDSVYWVGGRITDSQGRAIEGVRVMASTPILQIATTNAEGYWKLTGLSGTVRITPVREGRVFYPPSRVVSGNDANIDWNQTYTPIMGDAVIPLEQAKLWLKDKAPDWLHVVDLYYAIAPAYGIRPDVALAQACKETGYFTFKGLVQPWQNNLCGMGATGVASDGDTPLNGADPSRVCFQKDVHGSIFMDLATGVEAHIQHLYAYTCTDPLPRGKVLLSPRFTLVKRGSARYVEHLGAKENPLGVGWAYPGEDYGKQIVWNYIEEMLKLSSSLK
jgi:hypothetical protein